MGSPCCRCLCRSRIVNGCRDQASSPRQLAEGLRYGRTAGADSPGQDKLLQPPANYILLFGLWQHRHRARPHASGLIIK